MSIYAYVFLILCSEAAWSVIFYHSGPNLTYQVASRTAMPSLASHSLLERACEPVPNCSRLVVVPTWYRPGTSQVPARYPVRGYCGAGTVPVLGRGDCCTLIKDTYRLTLCVESSGHFALRLQKSQNVCLAFINELVLNNHEETYTNDSATRTEDFEISTILTSG